MRFLRNTLRQLGWPVDRMSFKQIAQELYRRWFQAPPDDRDAERTISAASAAGIVVALTCEGNFNAITWEDAASTCRMDPLSPEEKEIFLRDSKKKQIPEKERRRAHRLPGKEIVCWSEPDREKYSGAGFLVDYSAGGIAFISEKERTPRIGARLLASIRNRTRRSVDLGPATVVRSEVLTSELSLTCLRLEVQRPELIH